MVAKAVVDDISYDQTIECKIVDNERRKEGIYTVSYEGAEFVAYAQDGSKAFYKNDIVFVQVPQGNFDNQKFILGRRSDETIANQVFNFKMPFDDFIELRLLNSKDGNSIESIEGKYIANKPLSENEKDDLLWYYNSAENGVSLSIETKLGIQADFQTLLGNYTPISGKYGLRIVVTGLSMTTEEQESQDITAEYFFTNDDMYGNTYAYTIPYAQQKVFDVSQFLRIDTISIYFWQDCKFVDEFTGFIPYFEQEDPIVYLPENIFISGMEIYLGLGVDDITNERTMLYTYDPIIYGTNPTSFENRENLDTRTLRYAWVHRTGEKTFELIKDFDDLKKFQSTVEETEPFIGCNRDEIKYIRELIDYILEMKEDGETTLDKLIDKNKEICQQYEITLENIEDRSVECRKAEDELALGNDFHVWWYQYEYGVSSSQPLPQKLAGINWKYLPEHDDKFEIVVTPSIDRVRERYKVIAYHNGLYEVSNILVFRNETNKDEQNQTLAYNDTIILKCLRPEIRVEKDINQDEYEVAQLVVDDTLGNFYVYDKTGQVLENEDGERFSNIIYYIQVWVKQFDENGNGDYIPMMIPQDEGVDPITGELLAGPPLDVNWQWPQGLTMLEPVGALDETDRQYYSDASVEQSDSIFEQAKKITYKFKIASRYNYRKPDNQVTAIVNYNGTTYYAHKNFLFGEAGSRGTEYTPVITYLNAEDEPTNCIDLKDAAEGSWVDFKLRVDVYDRLGNIIILPEKTKIVWNYLTGYHVGKDAEGNETYISNIDQNRYLSYTTEGQLLFGRIYVSKNNKLNNHFIYDPEEDEITSPLDLNTSVSYAGIDMMAPAFEVIVQIPNEVPIMIRRGLLVVSNAELMNKYRLIIPDRIEYLSDGHAPLYYNGNFELQVYNQTDKENGLVPYVKWLGVNDTNTDDTPHLFKDYEVKGSTVKRQFVDLEGKTIEYKDELYRLRERDLLSDYASQWENFTESTCHFVLCTIFTHGDKTYSIAQSIVADRNLYPSGLVNEWNGRDIVVDEENSAIFSQMLAVGTKNALDNSFSGLLLGDWSDNSDDSLRDIGLYGMSNGAQTFSFKTDGTGFIGPSGGGRIYFDGRNAMLSNADETCYVNLNPAGTYNDLLGGYYSQNFLYAEVPTNENPSDMNLSDVKSSTGWARRYLEDSEKEYFIVDPARGVLISGGLVAKYGRLGDWYIFDTFLQSADGTAVISGGEDYISLDEGNILINGKPREPYIEMAGGEIYLNAVPPYAIIGKNARSAYLILGGARVDGYAHPASASGAAGSGGGMGAVSGTYTFGAQ